MEVRGLSAFKYFIKINCLLSALDLSDAHLMNTLFCRFNLLFSFPSKKKHSQKRGQKKEKLSRGEPERRCWKLPCGGCRYENEHTASFPLPPDLLVGIILFGRVVLGFIHAQRAYFWDFKKLIPLWKHGTEDERMIWRRLPKTAAVTAYFTN